MKNRGIVSTVLTPEMSEKLRSVAKERGVTVSALLREIVAEWLEKEGGGGEGSQPSLEALVEEEVLEEIAQLRARVSIAKKALSEGARSIPPERLRDEWLRLVRLAERGHAGPRARTALAELYAEIKAYREEYRSVLRSKLSKLGITPQ